MSDATSVSGARDRRWLILGVIGLAQLMVVLDLRGFLIHCPVLASARSWVICAAAIMVDGCAGVRSASIWRTRSQALPRCPSLASMVDE